MMDFDLFQKPIKDIQKECRGLLIQAFECGWTTTLIARVFMARAQATGVAPSCKELLQAIARGEFDYLFFDSTGQSLS
jgi:hypothetical protein